MDNYAVPAVMFFVALGVANFVVSLETGIFGALARVFGAF